MADQRVAVRCTCFLKRLAPTGVKPDHRTDARDKHDDTDAGPNDRRTRRNIADKRFGRKIACVRDRIVRPVGGRGPSCPEKERRQLSQFYRVRLGIFLNGVVLVAVGEHIGIMFQIILKGGGPYRIDGYLTGRSIISVLAHQFLQPGFQNSLLIRRQCVKSLSGLLVRPGVQDKDAFTVQIVCRPIRGYIRTVPPNRPDLHSAHRLPYILPVRNGTDIDDHAAVGSDDLIRDRRRLPEDLSSDPSEDRK